MSIGFQILFPTEPPRLKEPRASENGGEHAWESIASMPPLHLLFTLTENARFLNCYRYQFPGDGAR